MWQEAPFTLERPERQDLAVVVCSPHSGDSYPDDLLTASRLPLAELRRSEDFAVQRLAAAAPAQGAPLLVARFPRAYVDVNREPYELDPLLFEESLPPYANLRSPRVVAGLGTIARVVASGKEIYARRLTVAEALQRIERCYIPYHRALAALIAETQARFGFCVVIDCHSMPSLPDSLDTVALAASDMVLGDCHGSSAAPSLVELAAAELAQDGYRVALNAPYSGGFITRHYGRPAESVHALQIEIARRLYMDEAAIAPGPGFEQVARDLKALFAALGTWRPEAALPRAAE